MITIRDVASNAKVSVKTVSRVINNEAGVAHETRDTVMAVIEQLGFVPNISAHRLRSGRSEAFLLVLPRVESPYAAKLLRCVLAEARTFGYSVLVTEADPNHSSGSSLIAHSILRRQVDGILMAPPGADDPELFQSLQMQHIPCVAITPNFPDHAPFSVEATDRDGAAEAVRYLIDQGHRRIAHIRYKPQERFSRERYDGYCEAMRQEGLLIDSNLVCEGDNSPESGRLHALRLLTAIDRPTAFFAGNDEMATGVMSAALSLGLRVPDDISVIGFDDMPIAQQVMPSLTTVCQPVDQIAHVAVNMLIRAIEGENNEDHHLKISTHLVLRDSCAKHNV